MEDDGLFEKSAENLRNFLTVETELSISFADIALASEDPGKRARNAANAQRGYETVVNFLQKKEGLDGKNLSLVREMLANLEAKLDQLGPLPERK